MKELAEGIQFWDEEAKPKKSVNTVIEKFFCQEVYVMDHTLVKQTSRQKIISNSSYRCDVSYMHPALELCDALPVPSSAE